MKKEVYKIIRMTAVLCIVVLLSASQMFAMGSGEQDTIDVTFAHIFPPGHNLFEGAQMFSERLESESNGKIKVNLVPAGALGGMDSNHEGLLIGSVDITLVGEVYTSQFFHPMGMTAAPYAFLSWDHFRRYLESDLFAEFKDEYTKETGNHIVGTFTSGFRHVSANKPIRVPEDMKGLKIRVADTPLMFAMPKATGASPAPVAFSEVYLALQQGVVDAQENPLETIYNMKFYEVQDYISLTAHMMEPAHFVVSKILWDKLSEEEQQMLFRIGKEVSDYILDDAYHGESELVEIFEKEGVTVIRDVDKTAFAQACYAWNINPERAWTREQWDRLQALR